MKKTTFWVAALGCVALLVSGGLFASNMGFKLNYSLTGPVATGNPLTEEDGTNLYSYPYHSTATGAAALIADIGGATCDATGPVVSIAQYVKAGAGLSAYTGCAGTSFGLVAGEAYYVKVDADTLYVPSHF